MNSDTTNPVFCVVCGKAVPEDGALCHLRHDGRVFTLCCPMCLDLFQRAPDRFASGERPETIVEEILTNWRWKNGG